MISVKDFSQPVSSLNQVFNPTGSLEPDVNVLNHPKSRSSKTPSILIVDSNTVSRRMLKAMLKSGHHHIRESQKASEAKAILEQECIDVIVLDMVLPEVSGLELCRWLKTNRKTQFIPILMLTSVQGVENEIEGIASGADEFLIKPVSPAVVRTRINAMLRTKALIDSLEEAETILFALARSIEHRDRNTGLHCERLAAYAVMLGQALKLPAEDLTALYRGGFLHDIGKICIPDAILFKREALTAEEWEILRAHTIQGEAICEPMKSLAPILPIIRHHHERWDGGGYPDGLKGRDIPRLARILQVVDIYDALITARPYKPAYSREAAFQILEEEVERGWRDPELVHLFIELLRSNPDQDILAMRDSLSNLQTHLTH